MKVFYDDQDLWDEAYEWAYQRAAEEGDVDIDDDYEIVDAWAEEYYNYLTNQKG